MIRSNIHGLWVEWGIRNEMLFLLLTAHYLHFQYGRFKRSRLQNGILAIDSCSHHYRELVTQRQGANGDLAGTSQLPGDLAWRSGVNFHLSWQSRVAASRAANDPVFQLWNGSHWISMEATDLICLKIAHIFHLQSERLTELTRRKDRGVRSERKGWTWSGEAEESSGSEFKVGMHVHRSSCRGGEHWTLTVMLILILMDF